MNIRRLGLVGVFAIAVVLVSCQDSATGPTEGFDIPIRSFSGTFTLPTGDSLGGTGLDTLGFVTESMMGETGEDGDCSFEGSVGEGFTIECCPSYMHILDGDCLCDDPFGDPNNECETGEEEDPWGDGGDGGGGTGEGGGGNPDESCQSDCGTGEETEVVVSHLATTDVAENDGEETPPCLIPFLVFGELAQWYCDSDPPNTQHQQQMTDWFAGLDATGIQVCMDLAEQGRDLLNRNNIRVSATNLVMPNGVEVNGGAELGGGITGNGDWIVLSQTVFDHAMSASSLWRAYALQVMAHELDHSIGSAHLPGNDRLTTNSSQCSGIQISPDGTVVSWA